MNEWMNEQMKQELKGVQKKKYPMVLTSDRPVHQAHLSRCLVPANKAMLAGECVQLGQLRAKALTLLVTLVCKQDSRHRAAITQRHFGVQVTFPLENCLERGEAGHVEDDQRAHSLSVVHTSHVAIALLA